MKLFFASAILAAGLMTVPAMAGESTATKSGHEKSEGHKCDGSCGHKECKNADGSHTCGKSCTDKNCKHHKGEKH